MELTEKTVNKAVEQLVGNDVIDLLSFIMENGEVSELDLAEKLDESINNTRNMLYRLNGLDIVRYTRKKDPEKGWYVGHWNFNPERLRALMEKQKQDRIEELKKRLQKEKDQSQAFFICPNFCSRLDFHDATIYDFKCPECGTLLSTQDNSKTIKYLKDKIKRLTS